MELRLETSGHKLDWINEPLLGQQAMDVTKNLGLAD